MKDISAFFEKFKKLLQGDGVQKQIISETLDNVAKIHIAPEKIVIKDSIAYISSSPLVKNEIRMKKIAILSSINKSTFKKQIIDIK